MKEKERMDFCINCRKDNAYILQKKMMKKTIKEKEYTFYVTHAVCAECGEEMNLPGLIDKNIREIDVQYRSEEGIVSVDDIEKLMEIYKIGKAPLSLALGFGEITITRYLTGQMPSKEYSDVIRHALTSSGFMKKCLRKNKERLADTAYRKAMDAAEQLDRLFSVSDKMRCVISCIFENLGEVTPLMLQKLLYFTQGIYSALYNKPLFEEDCQAWIHGPVYPEVYDLFRDFKYNPIEDARFAIWDRAADSLTAEERHVVELVTNTFGLYSGKVLEKITHNETPWQEARSGYGDEIPSRELLSKNSIQKYYESVKQQFALDTEAGLNEYILSMLKRA